MTLNDIYHAIDPVALSLGPLQIRWYGLAYVAGFICAFLVIAKLSQRWKIRIDDDAFFTVVFCVIFGVILGGRLGYVLVYGDGYYLQHPGENSCVQRGRHEFPRGACGRDHWRRYRGENHEDPVPHVGRYGRCRRAHRPVLRPLRELRERRAVGRSTDMPWGVVFGALRARCRAIPRSCTKHCLRA